MRKISMHGIDIPRIDYAGNRYTVHYGFNRGWSSFDNKRQALKILNRYLDDRIHTAAHELEALCRLQRKTIKELI